MNKEQDVIVVTGATGYVGGRLVLRLLEEGWRVRAIGRSLDKLRARPWAAHPRIELVELNMLDEQALCRVISGGTALFYLVHSMNPEQKDFVEADRVIANNTARAAAAAEIQRIVYLGGLGEEGAGLSQHLRSRAKVAEVLQQGTVPVTVLRAAMIIGSGSASFEMLRYLVDRLPIMVTPRWIDTPNEPIAIRNVLTYLVGCLEHAETAGRTFDIGCGEVSTYRQLMQIYAEEAGLRRRLIVKFPLLTLRLSSWWIHAITPIPASLAKPLVEGLRNPVICRDREIRAIIPQEILSPREAIRRAIARYDAHLETHWSDAGELPPVESLRLGDPQWAGGLYRDRRHCLVSASPEAVWSVVARIGGANGWYHGTWLWKIRGWMDRLVGGVGFRMGRRDPVDIQVGDALDFWRVSHVKPGRHLCLVAEMKLPGRAVLEFCLIPEGGGTRLEQVATFRPKGLLGFFYWYAVTPFHAYIFGGMIQRIAVLSIRSELSK